MGTKEKVQGDNILHLQLLFLFSKKGKGKLLWPENQRGSKSRLDQSCQCVLSTDSFHLPRHITFLLCSLTHPQTHIYKHMYHRDTFKSICIQIYTLPPVFTILHTNDGEILKSLSFVLCDETLNHFFVSTNRKICYRYSLRCCKSLL